MAQARGGARRAPAWAVLCTVLGALVMLVAGGTLVAYEVLKERYAVEQRDLFGDTDEGEEYGQDVEGPLNILLAGLDTRPSRPEEPPRADAVLIVHIPAGMDRGYFISLPRDALVDIPPMEETSYLGGRDRLNAAMRHGARQIEGEELPNPERGFRLLAETVSDLTGIDRFDAGAVVRFEGFVDIVDALGGISVELEEEIVSRHRQPDGTHRPLGCGDYCGPQMVYQPDAPPCGPADTDGTFTCELEGWHALDVARQRYGLEDGDYGRQANQQVILKAIMGEAFSRDVVTNPVALDRVVRAGGDALVFDGRGREPIDFAFALREVRPGSIVSLGLPATNLGTGNAYQGEELQQGAYDLFEALRADRLNEFVVAHPDLVA